MREEKICTCSRFTFVACTGASAAVRYENLSPFANTVADIAVGVGAQGFLSSLLRGTPWARLQQTLIRTLFGQATTFLLAQLSAGEDKKFQEVCNAITLVALGIYIELYLEYLFLEKGYRQSNETSTNGPKLKPTFEPKSYNLLSIGTRLVTAGFSLAEGLNTIKDRVVSSVSFFYAIFFPSQIIGNCISFRLNRRIAKISQNGSEMQRDVTQLGISRTRQVLNIITALSVVVPNLAFIPFSSDPESTARAVQLPLIAAPLGLSDGVAAENEQYRLLTMPIEELEELMPIPPVTSINSRVRYVASQVWNWGVPLATTAEMAYFFVKQMIQSKGTPILQGALGAWALGFFPTFAVTSWAAATWDHKKRVAEMKHREENSTYSASHEESWTNWLRDKAVRLLMDPRILGINPTIAFFVVTNALKMSSEGIEDDPSAAHAVIDLLFGWTPYGLSMALEQVRVSTLNLRGTVFQYPLLVMVNGVLVAVRAGNGDIPA